MAKSPPTPPSPHTPHRIAKEIRQSVKLPDTILTEVKYDTLSKIMLKKLGLVLSTVLLAIAAFALSASPAAAESYTVKMGTDSYQLKFDPSTLTVAPGDTVKFQNNKLAPHNVVFDQEPLASLGMTASKTLFNPSDSYSVTIPDDIAPGDYSFYCSPHRGAGMTGTLTVE